MLASKAVVSIPETSDAPALLAAFPNPSPAIDAAAAFLAVSAVAATGTAAAGFVNFAASANLSSLAFSISENLL